MFTFLNKNYNNFKVNNVLKNYCMRTTLDSINKYRNENDNEQIKEKIKKQNKSQIVNTVLNDFNKKYSIIHKNTNIIHYTVFFLSVSSFVLFNLFPKKQN
jgi:transcription antitermination factor NusG